MLNLSVSVALEGELLNNILLIQDSLEKKYRIRFQKQHQTIPHINLYAGKISNFNKILNYLENYDFNSFKRKITFVGLGAFLEKTPIIYLRYLKSSNLIKFRYDLKTACNIWLEVDTYSTEDRWFPKTTIAMRDTNFKFISSLDNIIKNFNFKKEMIIKRILLIKFEKGKKEKLLKTIFM